jgi:hypothetical protein
MNLSSLRVLVGLLGLLQALLLTNDVTLIAISGLAGATLAAAVWSTRAIGWRVGRLA